MVISLDDAVAILNKWKDESANLLVAAESPFRQTLRGIVNCRNRRRGDSRALAPTPSPAGGIMALAERQVGPALCGQHGADRLVLIERKQPLDHP